MLQERRGNALKTESTNCETSECVHGNYDLICCVQDTPSETPGAFWTFLSIIPVLQKRRKNAEKNCETPDPYISHANYDLICCIQDGWGKNPRVSTNTAAFFATCVIVSLVGGFGLHMVLNNKKYREEIKIYSAQQAALRKMGGEMNHEDPSKLAVRALGWGSFYAVIGTGALGIIAVYTWRLTLRL